MARIPRYAVIPSNGRTCLNRAIAAIKPQVDRVIVVWNRSGELNYPAYMFRNGGNEELIRDVHFLQVKESREPNISWWWNQGLDWIDRDCKVRAANPWTKWDVAVLNDDAIVPEGWFDAVTGTMRQMQCAAGCSGAYGMPVLHTQNQAPPLATRMQGFAFILAGELGLRADEQFIWYCGDDDLGRRAAVAGGMVMVPGFPVNHLHPNGQVNDVLAAAIPGDMQRYVDKWGGRPW